MSTRKRVAQLRLFLRECFVDGRFDADKMRAAVGDFSAMGPERFLFTWVGRVDATQLLQTLSRATLVPQPEKSVNWETMKNLFFDGP